MKFQKDNTGTAMTEKQKVSIKEMKKRQEQQQKEMKEMQEKQEKLHARLRAYGSMAEQLDMLWHDMDEGRIKIDKKDKNTWYHKVKNAKEKNPLPK
jgi:hypothetical protein